VLDIDAEPLPPHTLFVKPAAGSGAALDVLAPFTLPLATNVLGDFDRDGRCDGLVAAGSDSVSIQPYAPATLGSAVPIHIPEGGSANLDTYLWSWVFGGRMTTTDIDRDGRMDLILGAPAFDEYGEPTGAQGGWAAIRGTGTGFAFPASVTRAGSPAFGAGIEAIGDFDGDGQSDLAIADPGAAQGAGRVYVLTKLSEFSWPNVDPTRSNEHVTVLDGIPTQAHRDWQGEYPFDGMHLGSTMTSAGDLDGDSRDDLLAGFAGYDQRGVVIEFGRAHGEPSTRIVFRAPGDPYPDPPRLLAAVGRLDLDGDRYADLALALEGAGERPGRLHVVHGGPHLRQWPASLTVADLPSLPNTRVWTQPTQAADFATALAPPVDLNSDGRTDLVVFGRTRGDHRDAAWVLYGATTQGLTDALLSGIGQDAATRTYGFLIKLRDGIVGMPPATCVCDLDGDRRRDLLIGVALEDFVHHRASAMLVVRAWE